DKPALAVANVPNMCHMDYGMLYASGSINEIAGYAALFPDKQQDVLETVRYFDVMNVADRIQIPVLISFGLQDSICMPEMIYAVYNRMNRNQKEIHPYPFMGHAQIGYHNRLGMEFMEEYRCN